VRGTGRELTSLPTWWHAPLPSTGQITVPPSLPCDGPATHGLASDDLGIINSMAAFRPVKFVGKRELGRSKRILRLSGTRMMRRILSALCLAGVCTAFQAPLGLRTDLAPSFGRAAACTSAPRAGVLAVRASAHDALDPARRRFALGSAAALLAGAAAPATGMEIPSNLKNLFVLGSDV